VSHVLAQSEGFGRSMGGRVGDSMEQAGAGVPMNSHLVHERLVQRAELVIEVGLIERQQLASTRPRRVHLTHAPTPTSSRRVTVL
jgi:hypothetical protein